MRRIQLWLAVITILTGLMLLAPQLRVRVLHETAAGRLVEVLPEPVGRQVRLIPVYEFTVTAVAPRRRTFGSRLVDARFRPINAPVVAPDRVDLLTRALLERPAVRVFYLANDPEGSAFIIDPLGPASSLQVNLGLGLIAVGALWWLAARRLAKDAI